MKKDVIMNEIERNQAVADGVILTCGCLLNNDEVTTTAVEMVIREAGVTRKEWNACVYTDEKEIIRICMNRTLRTKEK